MTWRCPLAVRSAGHAGGMTLVWFIVWLIFNNVGEDAPLTFDPVNWWAGGLLLAVGLDLARQHAPG